MEVPYEGWSLLLIVFLDILVLCCCCVVVVLLCCCVVFCKLEVILYHVLNEYTNLFLLVSFLYIAFAAEKLSSNKRKINDA